MSVAARQSDSTRSFRTRRRKHGHWYLWLLGVIVAVAAGGVASYLLRPTLSLKRTARGLASLTTGGDGLTITALQARAGDRTVRLVDHAGTLEPTVPLPAGSDVSVVVKAKYPWWASWSEGSGTTTSLQVTAPRVKLDTTVSEFPSGSAPTVRFTRSVQVVSWTTNGVTKTVHLNKPVRRVHLALAAGHAQHGTISVRAARYSWENLSTPASVTFFEGTGPIALVSPSPGNNISPTTPIRLTLSQSVRSVFGDRHPTLSVAKLTSTPAGTWSTPGPDVLEFQPAAGALWPGQQLQVQLPAAIRLVGSSTTTNSLSYTLPQGSMARLEQELAALDYLPFNWTAASGQAGIPNTVNAAAAAAYSTPQGNFTWRWSPPSLLAGLWQPGTDGIMTQGAVKAFENVNGLNTNAGLDNPLLWPYLAQALAANHQNPNGYTWVDVSKTLPETLTVWNNGKAVVTTPTNTGIASEPTADGTYAVYLRYPSQIMRGTNPDGTKYADPVKWVSYFNGSDAIHGFIRAKYGFPQSLGCAELPYAMAAKVYPYTHIGTLVTVH